MTAAQAVAEIRARGSLLRTTPARRTVTIDGISLPTIRWQAAICSLMIDMPDGLPPRAKHVVPAIRKAIES